MKREEIHTEMEKHGIRHLCHFDDSIPQGDLGRAGMLCAECRIMDGRMSLDDVIAGRVDPSSGLEAYEQAMARQWCRIALDIYPELTARDLITQLNQIEPDCKVSLWYYLKPEFQQATTCDGKSTEPHFRIPLGSEADDIAGSTLIEPEVKS